MNENNYLAILVIANINNDLNNINNTRKCNFIILLYSNICDKF